MLFRLAEQNLPGRSRAHLSALDLRVIRLETIVVLVFALFNGIVWSAAIQWMFAPTGALFTAVVVGAVFIVTAAGLCLLHGNDI